MVTDSSSSSEKKMSSLFWFYLFLHSLCLCLSNARASDDWSILDINSTVARNLEAAIHKESTTWESQKKIKKLAQQLAVNTSSEDFDRIESAYNMLLKEFSVDDSDLNRNLTLNMHPKITKNWHNKRTGINFFAEYLYLNLVEGIYRFCAKTSHWSEQKKVSVHMGEYPEIRNFCTQIFSLISDDFKVLKSMSAQQISMFLGFFLSNHRSYFDEYLIKENQEQLIKRIKSGKIYLMDDFDSTEPRITESVSSTIVLNLRRMAKVLSKKNPDETFDLKYWCFFSEIDRLFGNSNTMTRRKYFESIQAFSQDPSQQEDVFLKIIDFINHISRGELPEDNQGNFFITIRTSGLHTMPGLVELFTSNLALGHQIDLNMQGDFLSDSAYSEAKNGWYFAIKKPKSDFHPAEAQLGRMFWQGKQKTEAKFMGQKGIFPMSWGYLDILAACISASADTRKNILSGSKTDLKFYKRRTWQAKGYKGVHGKHKQINLPTFALIGYVSQDGLGLHTCFPKP